MPTEVAPALAVIAFCWTTCPPEPLIWIRLRELLLFVLNQPALLLPVSFLFVAAAAAALRCSGRRALLLALLLPLALSWLYTPASTRTLEAWLHAQLPPAPRLIPSSPAVAVIPGRGPLIAAATTSLAAQLLQQRRIQSVYVSGDAVSTAEQLVRLLGVSPARVAGDSCARTTWENAARTARWLRREAPSSAAIPPVLLITDPWQLPRATRALQRQGLTLLPVAATPVLPPAARNRLALREAAGTLLYALQGRL